MELFVNSFEEVVSHFTELRLCILDFPTVQRSLTYWVMSITHLFT